MKISFIPYPLTSVVFYIEMNLENLKLVSQSLTHADSVTAFISSVSS